MDDSVNEDPWSDNWEHAAQNSYGCWLDALAAIRMTQNRSSAVMQQRNEPDDSLDDFPTMPWGGRALCEQLRGRGLLLAADVCLEPAANRGYLARGLNDYFSALVLSDVHDYGAGYDVRDFLFPNLTEPMPVNWIITNPPFRLAQQFAERAHELAPNYALLVRSAFLEGQARHEGLFSKRPPNLILQFTERLPMNRGVCHAAMTTATAYCWLVWTHRMDLRPCIFDWIPPCRKRLERAGDYDA